MQIVSWDKRFVDQIAVPGRLVPGLRIETMEHGGENPDTMPQAIKLIDADRVPAFMFRSLRTAR